jgi:hypothetical protein
LQAKKRRVQQARNVSFVFMIGMLSWAGVAAFYRISSGDGNFDGALCWETRLR